MVNFKKNIKYSIGCLILIITICAIYTYFHYRERHPETDDAYVEANVVHLATRLTDVVDKVYVVNQQHVHEGQLLFTLDATPYQLALARAKDQWRRAILQMQADNDAIDQAKALILQREAELKNVQADTKRKLALAKHGYISKSAADVANKNLLVAIQNLSSAKSELKRSESIRGEDGKDNAAIHEAHIAVQQAQLNLKYTRIVAPADGYVENFTLRPGSKVNAYQEVLALVQDRTYWVNANFKETQLTKMHEGDPAFVKIEIYPGVTFKGVVESISAGSGSIFSLLPPENATGNWIKVTQRFPVRIRLLDIDYARYPVRLGASSTVTVATSARG